MHISDPSRTVKGKAVVYEEMQREKSFAACIEQDTKNPRITLTSMASNFDYLSLCVLPERMKGPDAYKEWIAENIITFVNESYFCYSGARVDNPDWTATLTSPSKGFPSHVKFNWKDESGLVRPLDADQYLEKIFRSIEDDIKNPKLFPQDFSERFPEIFMNRATKIFRRICRVYAIIFGNASLYARNYNNIFQRALKQILFFTLYWKLLNVSEGRKLFPTHFGPIYDEFQSDLSAEEVNNRDNILGL